MKTRIDSRALLPAQHRSKTVRELWKLGYRQHPRTRQWMRRAQLMKQLTARR
jgi:hypothetical protein